MGSPKVVKHCPEGHVLEMAAASCPRCGWQRASGLRVEARAMTEMTLILGAPAAAPPPPEPEGDWVLRLEVVAGPATGHRYDIAVGRWKLGRAPREEAGFERVAVPDPGLSRDHFRLEAGVAAVILVDLGSTNGTFVGSSRVERHILREGDLVRAGGSSFRASLRVQAPA
jgi:hypothetical protein